MNTITVWLLIAISNGSHSSIVVVGQFADRGECEVVRHPILLMRPHNLEVQCIRATVVKP